MSNKVIIDLEDLYKICKYSKPAFDIDRNCIQTCRLPEAIPHGESWGICDGKSCPLFSREVIISD